MSDEQAPDKHTEDDMDEILRELEDFIREDDQKKAQQPPQSNKSADEALKELDDSDRQNQKKKANQPQTAHNHDTDEEINEEDIIEGFARLEDATPPIQQAEQISQNPKAELAGTEIDAPENDADQGFIIPKGVELKIKDYDEDNIIIQKLDGSPFFYSKNNNISAAHKINDATDYQNMLECLVANFKPPYTLYAPSNGEKDKMQEAVTKFLENHADHPEYRSYFDKDKNPIFTDHKKFEKHAANPEATPEITPVKNAERVPFFESLENNFQQLKGKIEEDYRAQINQNPNLAKDIETEMNTHIEELTQVHQVYMDRLSSLSPEKAAEKLSEYNEKITSENNKQYKASENKLGITIKTEPKNTIPPTNPAKTASSALTIHANNKAKDNANAPQATPPIAKNS